MPVIGKSKRTVLPTSGRGVQGISRVTPDISLESAVGDLGAVIEQKARQQQQEEDNNFIYNSITDYNQELIPVLQEENEKTGSNTSGNIDRISQKSKTIQDRIFEKASPRVKDSLKAKFSRIDLANQTEMSRVRATGIKVERQDKRSRAIDISKRVVLDSPFKALNEINNLAEMYDDEVANGTLTDSEADELTKEAANELAVSAITSIGAKSGPTAQLGMLESGMFDSVISSDQKEKFITEAQKLEKAIDKQQKIDVDRADKEAKDALTVAQATTNNEFFSRWNDPDEPLTLPEIEADTSLSFSDKRIHAEAISKTAQSGLIETNWTQYNSILSDLYTEKISEWTQQKIMAEVKEGGLAIGGKGSESGAQELISIYEKNIKPTKDKNPKLGVILKQVDSLSKRFIFVPEAGGDISSSKQIDNAIRHADVTQAIIGRVDRGEDPSDAFQAEMKPYREEKSKSLLDTFFNSLKFSNPFNVGRVVGQTLRGEETPEEIEVRSNEEGRQEVPTDDSGETIQDLSDISPAEEFNAEGSGYDFKTVQRLGIQPDETGHFPSRDATTGLILKGKKHPTFNKTIAAEQRLGFKIIKIGDRWYSFKPDKEGIKLFLKALNLPETKNNMKLGIERLK